MSRSWETTIAGIGAILVAIGGAATAYFDGDPATVVDWEVTLAAIVAGIGLIRARDNNKSSEAVGTR